MAQPAPLQQYQCPLPPRLPGQDFDFTRCGFVFRARADEQGHVDCPRCKAWWKPEPNSRPSAEVPHTLTN